jgi:acetyl esterase/lipase
VSATITTLARCAMTALLCLAAGCASGPTGPSASAQTAERPPVPRLDQLPAGEPDRRIAYGNDPSQFGDLRVPAGPGPHPVVVLVHGGCFKAAYATNRDLAAMADALRNDGIATWNIEYRRLGEAGAGWPGTYLDVARAVDHLRHLAAPHRLDLRRVVIVGHSAGGHLALWSAARSRVPAGNPVHTPDPLPLRGAVNLAGPVDMSANIAGYEGLCRDTVITNLLGGTPSTVPERYAAASPIRLLPLGVPHVLVAGDREDFVPRPLMETYVTAAAAAGDAVRLVVLPNADHFQIASPLSATWRPVAAIIGALLDGRMPAGGSR